MRSNRRIIKYRNAYYPQYRGWFLWHYYSVDDYQPSFATMEGAIEFMENKSDSNEDDYEVVWEGRA